MYGFSMIDRISIYDLLYNRNEEIPFLKQVVTEDETGIAYNKVERKNFRKKSSPKASLHPKDMLDVWCNWKRILYYERLPNIETINSGNHCFQLDELKTAIEQKQPEIVNWESCFIGKMDSFECLLIS
ncbi:HTH_48 domain-containing protein [Trichonephila clavipes]|nr:HTH_48 domain-containing protein [Trichonephila clavipes]